MHLYEAHLPVADTGVAQAFYTDVVGMQFACRDPCRDIVFLWAGDDRRSMVGLWGPMTTYGGRFHESHLAFRVSLAELLAAGQRLHRSGVMSQDFGGTQTDEPSVIGWMPSAQLYFRDPDGHLVEFIALLDDTPDPSFIGSLSQWRKKTNQTIEPTAGHSTA
ncbi:MAG TPA: VOC family protein [Chthoniobacterales bacterium]|jgi:lactoylglutathione lyase